MLVDLVKHYFYIWLIRLRLSHDCGWHSWIPHTSHYLVYYWLSMRYSVRCQLLNLTLTSHCKLLYINLIDGYCEVWGIVLKKFLKRRGWHAAIPPRRLTTNCQSKIKWKSTSKAVEAIINSSTSCMILQYQITYTENGTGISVDELMNYMKSNYA